MDIVYQRVKDMHELNKKALTSTWMQSKVPHDPDEVLDMTGLVLTSCWRSLALFSTLAIYLRAAGCTGVTEDEEDIWAQRVTAL